VRFKPTGSELGAEGTTWWTTRRGIAKARYTAAVISVTGQGVNARGLPRDLLEESIGYRLLAKEPETVGSKGEFAS
jgi:hypothetical protein